ncbi:SRR1-like protein [Bagarius yarrelli]|uniref:SRR1-like protein n=1 Tax=Bagarius yarrelli TaxID=175774 RepID=A0A556V587_BAGYA|nr:SRR1-like protein [Bagarius yarrelli]
MADGSEWQIVRRGRGKRPQLDKLQTGGSVDCERSKHRITEAINELRCENFWPEWKGEFTLIALSVNVKCFVWIISKMFPVLEIMSGAECRTECVCYGLGNFSSCMCARYQLAMLLLLLDELQVKLMSKLQRGFD